MTTHTLTPYEAKLLATAAEGLATQLASAAARMPHGPAQLDTCHAVGTLRRLAQRLPK